MFVRRCMMLAPVVAIAYPHKAQARVLRTTQQAQQAQQASYREQFDKANNEDNKVVIQTYRDKLIKKYGYADVIATFSDDEVKELHYIFDMYTKPLSAQMRIYLRGRLLPLLEKSKGDTLELYKYIAEYYEIM